MSSKTIISIVSFMFSVMALGLTFLQTFLLYKHVEATQLLWILWVVSIPTTITLHLLSHLLKDAMKKGSD